MNAPDRAIVGRFQPGQVANPNGRPLGSRNRFSEEFYRDIAAEWQRSGPDALAKMALTDPSRYVSLCASLIPRDVSLTLSAQLPGGLDSEDWASLQGVLTAVRQAFPDHADRKPEAVLNHVLEALRAHDAKVIEGR